MATIITIGSNFKSIFLDKAWNTLQSENSILLVIDIQENLADKILNFKELLERNLTIIDSATKLGIPVVFTQQYTQGLGNTLQSLIKTVDQPQVFEKIYFDATKEPGFLSIISNYDRSQVVVTGTEAHVCVLQTALSLKQRGYDTWLCADAIGSRKNSDKVLAIERARSSKLNITSTEMVLFEWLSRADTEDFRSVLPKIRNLVR